MKQTKSNFDVVRSVVQPAERVLGIGGIEPSILPQIFVILGFVC